MGIISDWVTSKTKIVDDALDDAGRWGSSIMGKAKEYEKFGREMHRSWIWDNREAISGEAKTLHPFQFADFTPLRWIGVTRLPQTAAKGVEAGVKGARSLNKIGKKIGTWSTTKTQHRKLPNLKRNLKPLGRAALPIAKSIMQKTSKGTKKGASWIKKNPKKTIAGTGAALIASGIRNRGRDSSEEETYSSWTRKKKVSRAKWVT